MNNELEKIPVRNELKVLESGQKRTNPLANVFDGLVKFCQSRTI